MSKLRIDITGFTGAGKSTIGTLIAKTLKEHGFQNVKTDVLNELRVDRVPKWLEDNEKRLDTLKEDTEVIIRECWPDEGNWESDPDEWLSRFGEATDVEIAEKGGKSFRTHKERRDKRDHK